MTKSEKYDFFKDWGERQKKYADEKKQAGEKLLSLIKDLFVDYPKDKYTQLCIVDQFDKEHIIRI